MRSLKVWHPQSALLIWHDFKTVFKVFLFYFPRYGNCDILLYQFKSLADGEADAL